MANINLTRAFLPLHARARGLDTCPLFRDPHDKAAYLGRFVSVARQERVAIHAYCLLDEELHFLLTARTDDAIPALFKRVHTWWSQFLNSAMKRVGHVFGDRYHSCLLDKEHYWASLRYIETAPRRNDPDADLSTFRYCSAVQRLTGKRDGLVRLAMTAWKRRFTIETYPAFLAESVPEQEDRLNASLTSGRPCGSEEWIQRLVRQTGRRLRANPRGRPPISQLTLAAGR